MERETSIATLPAGSGRTRRVCRSCSLLFLLFLFFFLSVFVVFVFFFFPFLLFLFFFLSVFVVVTKADVKSDTKKSDDIYCTSDQNDCRSTTKFADGRERFGSAVGE